MSKGSKPREYKVLIQPARSNHVESRGRKCFSARAQGVQRRKITPMNFHLSLDSVFYFGILCVVLGRGQHVSVCVLLNTLFLVLARGCIDCPFRIALAKHKTLDLLVVV